jgi:hypothetical protein
MKTRFFAFALVAAGLAGCATDPTATPPGPAWAEREIKEGRPGMFGDLRWNVDLSGKYQTVRGSEEDAYKKWREDAQADSRERREFEEWREWQEWKRKNPK